MDIPVSRLMSREIPVTPPSRKPFGNKKPFRPTAASNTPITINTTSCVLCIRFNRARRSLLEIVIAMFPRYKCIFLSLLLSHSLLVSQPPFRYLVVTGQQVITVCARHKILTGQLHPPAPCLFALQKYGIYISKGYMKFPERIPFFQQRFFIPDRAPVHEVPQHLRYLSCGEIVSIISRAIAVNTVGAELCAHTCIAGKRAGLFAAEPVWRKTVGRSVCMLDDVDVQAEQISAAQYRFRLFKGLSYLAQAETVKTQFVHRFQHARVYKITLEADMIVMTDIIRLFRQHIHQEAGGRNGAFFLQVYQRIGHTYLYHVLLCGIGLVLCIGKIMRTAQYDNGLMRMQQFSQHRSESSIRICQANALLQITKISDLYIFVPVI